MEKQDLVTKVFGIDKSGVMERLQSEHARYSKMMKVSDTKNREAILKEENEYRQKEYMLLSNMVGDIIYLDDYLQGQCKINEDLQIVRLAFFTPERNKQDYYVYQAFYNAIDSHITHSKVFEEMKAFDVIKAIEEQELKMKTLDVKKTIEELESIIDDNTEVLRIEANMLRNKRIVSSMYDGITEEEKDRLLPVELACEIRQEIESTPNNYHYQKYGRNLRWFNDKPIIITDIDDLPDFVYSSERQLAQSNPEKAVEALLDRQYRARIPYVALELTQDQWEAKKEELYHAGKLDLGEAR